MVNKILRVVLLGAPGSGKGTISSRLVDKYSFCHISPGDILRSLSSKKTKEGIYIQSYLERGELLPDDFITKLVFKKISELNSKSYLLDGFPRTVAQARALNELKPLHSVLALDVPHQVIIERVRNRWVHLSSGRVYNKGFNEPKVRWKDDITGDQLIQRDDDKPEILALRLRDYEAHILNPLSKFYSQKNILKIFHGKSTEEIWPQIDQFLMETLL